MERERSGKETSKLKPSSSHVAATEFKTKRFFTRFTFSTFKLRGKNCYNSSG